MSNPEPETGRAMKELKKYLETMPVSHGFAWAMALFLMLVGLSHLWELFTR